MRSRIALSTCTAVLVGILLFASPTTAFAQGFGIKGGWGFPTFSTHDLSERNRTGWQVGAFFGGGRTHFIGVQAEVNFLRKEFDMTSGGATVGHTKLDYIQAPTLLRLNLGTKSKNGFAIYGIIGPSFEFLVKQETTGFGQPGTINNAFESFDIGLMGGLGVEITRLILEGRYTHGFRNLNKSLPGIPDVKGNLFAFLIGIRFN